MRQQQSKRTLSLYIMRLPAEDPHTLLTTATAVLLLVLDFSRSSAALSSSPSK
jgi:hypothetical protein